MAVTGNAVDDDVNAFFKAGVEHLVVKPMTSAKLDEVLGCFGEINKASASEKLKALSASEYAKNV